MDAFVKVRDLRKRFGDLAAVDGVSFEVGEGHTLALLGPSGCGKTTILRSIAGLETPEHGSIEIGGRAVFDGASRTNLLPEERELGIVFQSYAVWPHMSVADNVGFPLRVRGVAKAERAARVDRILEIVGLSAARDKPAPDLSGGQQQRVALARALVHEPRLVLFDEPLSNLDAQLRDQMRLELKVLQDRLRFTAIYVTHDQAEAFALAELVVVMNWAHRDDRFAPRGLPASAYALRCALPRAQCMAGNIAGADVRRAGCRCVTRKWRLLTGFRSGAQSMMIRPSPPARRWLPACARSTWTSAPLRLIGPSRRRALRFPRGRFFAGEVRAASFLGLEEEFMIVIAGMELRAVCPASGVGTGDAVEVSIRPQDCLIFRATAGRLDE